MENETSVGAHPWVGRWSLTWMVAPLAFLASIHRLLPPASSTSHSLEASASAGCQFSQTGNKIPNIHLWQYYPLTASHSALWTFLFEWTSSTWGLVLVPVGVECQCQFSKLPISLKTGNEHPLMATISTHPPTSCQLGFRTQANSRQWQFLKLPVLHKTGNNILDLPKYPLMAMMGNDIHIPASAGSLSWQLSFKLATISKICQNIHV